MEIKEREFKIISVWARSEHQEGSCFDFCQRLACFGFGSGHHGTLRHRAASGPGGPKQGEPGSRGVVNSISTPCSFWEIVQVPLLCLSSLEKKNPITGSPRPG